MYLTVNPSELRGMQLLALPRPPGARLQKKCRKLHIKNQTRQEFFISRESWFTNRAVFAVNPLSTLNEPPFEITVFDKAADGNFLKFLAIAETRFEIKGLTTRGR